MPELNGNTLAIAGILIAALIAQLRLVSRKLDVLIPALMERSRRRDQRRRRRESSAPPARRRPSEPAPESFDDEEDTDIHNLIELEREHQRARRNTGRQRHPGERPPRPGTHHD